MEYLSHVPEVKDTVDKQSLLCHLCTYVVDHFLDSTDLFSEIPAISRAAKVRMYLTYCVISYLLFDYFFCLNANIRLYYTRRSNPFTCQLLEPSLENDL